MEGDEGIRNREDAWPLVRVSSGGGFDFGVFCCVRSPGANVHQSDKGWGMVGVALVILEVVACKSPAEHEKDGKCHNIAAGND